MEMLVRFFRKLWLFFRRDKFGRELEEEMSFHREQSEKEFQSAGWQLMRHGMQPDAASENDLCLREQKLRDGCVLV